MTVVKFLGGDQTYMNELEFIDIFGDNLRDLMIERNYTQRSLAKESEISEAAISRYLKKERMPTLRAVINLSLSLSCDVDDLIPTYDYIK